MRRLHSPMTNLHDATNLSTVPSPFAGEKVADRADEVFFAAPRSGKMLIQVMVYLTLMSSLLGLGALCLHAAFRVDEVDLKDSLLLRSLVRCEQQLRDDNRTGRRSGTNQSATFQVETATKMILALPKDRQIVWESHRGVLTRRVLKQDVLESTDRFAFPAGSSIEFQAGDSGGAIVRIHEPSAVVVYAKAADGSTHPSKPDSVATPTAPDGATVPRFIEIQLRGAP